MWNVSQAVEACCGKMTPCVALPRRRCELAVDVAEEEGEIVVVLMKGGR